MKLPLVPTAMAAAGVPLLIYLGLWQLERREEKRVELAAFAAPVTGVFACRPLAGPVRQVGGTSVGGRPGYSHRAGCTLAGEGQVPVDLGWTPRPVVVRLAAGPRDVRGSLVRVPGRGALLVAAEAAPPLVPSTPPESRDRPNNHLVYAVQWFGFAITLAVIYVIYARRWRRERYGPPVLS